MMLRGEKNNLINTVHKLNASKVCLYIAVIIFFGLILILNIYYPICLDDWNYSLICGELPVRHVQSVSDILQSQYNHYNIWGGRSVVHTIDQFLLLLDKPIMDVLNSLAYISYVYLIYYICKKKVSSDVLFFILINISIWFLQPAFFSTVIWLTGASNYLWGTLIIILFVYPYFLFFTGKKSKESIGRTLLFFLVGILAGWTNENTALAMIFIIISFIVYPKIKGEKLKFWAVSGLIGVCIGYIIMVMAPGNYVRMNQTLALLGQAHKSLFQLLPYRIYSIMVNFWYMLVLLYALYGASMYVYVKQNKNKISKEVLFSSLVFFIAGNISIWCMVASPEFPLRAWFGIISFMIIALGILFQNTQSVCTLRSKAYYFLLLCGCVLFMIDYSVKCRNVYRFHYLMESRIDFIYEEKKKGVRDIIINEQIVIPDIYPEYTDVTQYPDVWQNRAYLDYFDLNSIVYRPVN